MAVSFRLRYCPNSLYHNQGMLRTRDQLAMMKTSYLFADATLPDIKEGQAQLRYVPQAP